jgi:hypothetical protein
MSTGALTFKPKLETSHLNFNFLNPHVSKEVILESIELSLNVPGYIPFLSTYTGSCRLLYGISLLVCGIFHAIFDAKKMIELERSESPVRHGTRPEHFFGIHPGAPATLAKRVQLYLRSVTDICKLAPSPDAENEQIIGYYEDKIRHLQWAVHGLANIFRSIVEISFPVGVGNLTLFLYDNFKKYRFEYVILQKNTGDAAYEYNFLQSSSA